MAGALKKLQRVGQAAEKAGKKAAQAKREVILDQEGNPLRVYHGTTKGDLTFEPRDRGTYFTSEPELANEYTYRNFFRPGTEGAVYPAFLSMENPLIIDARGKRNDNIPFPGQEWKPKVFGNLPQGAVSVEKAFERAIQAGHDGLIVRNVVDSADRKGKTKGDVFVVQDPTQIRSAFGGEETPEMPNPDINKAEGGPIDHALKAWHESNMAKGGRAKAAEEEKSLPSSKELEKMSLDEFLENYGGFPTRYPGQTQPLPADSADDWNKERQDQAVINNANWLARNLPQPINPLLQTFRNLMEQRARKQGPPERDIARVFGYEDVDPDMIPVPGATNLDAEFRSFASGGEVHMQGGGDLRSQVEKQLSAGVPVFADPGIQGQIAKQIIDEQEAARVRQEQERRARIEALPFSERLVGRAEAAKTLGSAVGRSMVSPYVALAKGEEFAKQFAEDVPVPKTEAGAYYTGTAAEMLEGPAKMLEAAKIPDTPFFAEIGTGYVPGLGRQLSGIAGKAMRSIDQAIPENLKNLPVGMSTKSVGPEGEKVSINELIRRLEAGEEMTPEQRQKAEYSKAQKEKYAAANVAKAEKKAAKTTEYRGRHTAPGRESGAPLFDVTGGGTMYPDDIYSSKGAQYYGHFGKNDPMDMESISIIQGLRGDPNAEVTIYRAVPKDEKITTINPGDWVTINPEYAKYHGDSVLRGDYKIVSKRVPVGDVFTNADSIHEFGYDPVIAKKSAEVRVPANQSGFFSSVEKAAANLKREEGSGDAFLSDIMKFNPSKGELEATGIVDFLKGKKNVTRQEVNDFINQNKVEIEEVIRGRDILTESERTKLNEIERALSKGWYDIPEQDLDWYESTKQRLLATPAARFDREGLVLPGGTNYKEILLKLPQSKSQPEIMYKTGSDLREKINEFEALGFRPDAIEEAAKFIDQKGSVESALKAQDSKIAKGYGYTRSEKDAGQVLRAILQGHKKQIDESEKSIFRTQHWPDDPNTLAHIRVQDMTIGGKKTLVIEEIQSDWHQEGRKKGYRQPGKEWEVFDPKDGKPIERFATEDEAKGYADRLGSHLDYAKAEGPPEAPYKKDWYQLGMKRIMKYAADNDYDQIALVGPEEQIRRGSLGTHIDGLYYEKRPDGSIKLEAEKNGSLVMDKVIDPKDLELYVGKDVAAKILKSKDGDGTLTGDDLKIGGEGMRQYYDRNYPEVMNKLGRNYQTQAKKTNFVIKEFEPDDVEEVDIGEVDRFRRPVMGYRVRDRETGEEVAFEYDFDKALNEANKKAPSTSMWLMDLPSKMKSDVKIGQPFAKGGAVKVDKKLQSWHKIQKLAKGGVIQKLAKAGQKAARMSREEAEKAGYWHPISETKLAKPIGEYKATVIEAPETKMTPRKSVTVEELQGGVAIPLAGDRAAAGKIIKEIEGTPMDVMLEGGPDFMRMHPGAAWASGQGVLSMLAKRIKSARESGQPIYGVYTAMSPQAVDFNTMMTESLLNQLDVRGLSKKDRMAFNQAVKEVKGQGGKPKAPNFPGLDDPELREKLLSGPGGQRDAFVKAMSKAEFQKKGFPDVAAARLAVTEPELLDVPRGSSGFTVARLDPEARIFEQSGHSTYPLDIAGEYAGGLERQLPVEVMYPSHFQAKQLMGSTPAGAHKSLELFAPLQYLDQEWLDNAMKYLELQKQLTGRKKGGLARSQGIENG